MRTKTAAMCLALAFTTTAGGVVAFLPQAAQAQGQYQGGQYQGGQYQGQRGSYDMFYRELANDGRWIDHPQHGWVWYPTNVREDWRPYSDGRWVWTDRHGWYWQSNERHGWATEHYGRWGYDRQYGHIWVPGEEWAPAWVSFRNNDDAIGWAPLPPETLGMTLLSLLAGGNRNDNYRYVDMSDSYYQPRWTFVPTRNFTDERVYNRAYSYRDNERYLRATSNATNYTTINNYTVNRSIDPRRIETVTGRRLDTVQVNRLETREPQLNTSRTGTINVYQPQIERDDKAAPPPAARALPQDRPVVKVDPAAVAPNERSRPEGQDRGRQDRDRKLDDDKKAMTVPGGAPATRATPAIPATPAQPGVSGPATPATPATPAARATPNDRGGPADNGKPTSIKPQRAASPAVPAKPAERATPADRSDRSAPSQGATPATRATPAEPAKPAVVTPQDRGRQQPATVARPDEKSQGRGNAPSEPAARGKSEERGKSDGKGDSDCGKPGQAACR
jgi:hypothetical protein